MSRNTSTIDSTATTLSIGRPGGFMRTHDAPVLVSRDLYGETDITISGEGYTVTISLTPAEALDLARAIAVLNGGMAVVPR